jgi:ribose 1,5-bisphosphate isomerase (EC 5.3.1.-)
VIPEEVLRIAEDIREMRVRGASRIARAAVEALLLAAERYQGSDPGEFARYMRRVAEILVSTRPTAVTLPNAVNYVVSALRGARGTARSCESSSWGGAGASSATSTPRSTGLRR